MNVVLKSLAVFLTVIAAVQAGVEFTIWGREHEKASAGVLMVKVDGGSIGNVCQRRYSSTSDITSATAEEACKNVSYHSLEKVDLLRYDRYRSSSSNYKFVSRYSSRIYNLRWLYDSFTYTASDYCSSSYYYTFISCQCNADFYNTTEGCRKCPAGSTSPVHSSICHCPAGQHWTEGYCKDCTENTYSTANSTECTPCPAGSYSREGAAECLCDNGLHMVDSGTCRPCEDDYYSYNRSNVCTQCPGDSTAVMYQGFCSCSAGQRWQFIPGQEQEEEDVEQEWEEEEVELQAGTCKECDANHYSKYNSTSCCPCPLHSTSPYNSDRCYCQPGYKWVEINATRNHTHGATTLHDYCEICPENHFSKFGALNCTQCPHFKAATTGSEYCYRCTLGQYWENHNCLECPEHLFGDGVHCNKCPEGFKVLRGFCYRDVNSSGHRDVNSSGHRYVVVDEGSYAELKEEIVASSSVSYLSAVLTAVLLYFGYSKRKVLSKFLNFLNCRLSVKADLREGVEVNVAYNDLMAREGEQVVRSEDEKDDSEEDCSEDDDICCESSGMLKMVENEYSESERIYEDI